MPEKNFGFRLYLVLLFDLCVSVSSVFENAGHESMVVHARVQQTMVDFLRGGDVSKTKIAIPKPTSK